jgi:hypothetical protein
LIFRRILNNWRPPWGNQNNLKWAPWVPSGIEGLSEEYFELWKLESENGSNFNVGDDGLKMKCCYPVPQR